MSAYSVAPLEKLVEQFEKMPGIGAKTAQRLAYFVLNLPKSQAEEFANAIMDAHTKIKYCKVCCNLTDQELCPVCRNVARDKSVICVVDPDQLSIKELLARVGADSPVKEVIMATNATVEGDATAMYLSRLLKPMGIKVTRLAYGIPVGGDLEYADENTLARALEGRNEL